MSLIALRDRLRGGRNVARSLLLLIALTGALIIGLLAMHSLTTHTTPGADPAMAVAAAGSVLADDHHSHSEATEEECADCRSSHSEMLGMACVLGLLVTVFLLARPRPGRMPLSMLPRPKPTRSAPAVRPRVRPPSLLVLCISRT